MDVPTLNTNKMLDDLGIEDGDTVKMYGHEFDYYHE
ncbi:MAG: DUF1967 domain-containing protein [Prevotella sp.]|nr:DUF1967 domain-containing protein [Prevotella sp.]